MAGLRVISGSGKGRRLRMVPGCEVRPITDRVKEALFNIIGQDIMDAHFLDLFAGTGSVGIEALSRGAERAVFVDAGSAAVKTVQANLEHTRLTERAKVVRGDAFSYLQRPDAGEFDYVYIAPPQYHGLWSRAVEAIDGAPVMLNPDAWVVAQMHPREYLKLGLSNLVEFDQRRYGSTLLCFFELPGD